VGSGKKNEVVSRKKEKPTQIERANISQPLREEEKEEDRPSFGLTEGKKRGKSSRGSTGAIGLRVVLCGGKTMALLPGEKRVELSTTPNLGRNSSKLKKTNSLKGKKREDISNQPSRRRCLRLVPKFKKKKKEKGLVLKEEKGGGDLSQRGIFCRGVKKKKTTAFVSGGGGGVSISQQKGIGGPVQKTKKRERDAVKKVKSVVIRRKDRPAY